MAILIIFLKTLIKHTVNESKQGLGVHKGKAQAKRRKEQLQKLLSAAMQKAPLSLLLQYSKNEAWLKKLPCVTNNYKISENQQVIMKNCTHP